MTDNSRIFVILDPTTMNQPSLVMAETIAADVAAAGTTGHLSVHVYCCIAEAALRVPPGMDREQAAAEEQERIENWVERITAHTRTLGFDISTEVEIQPNWRDAIVAAVDRQKPMVAIKNMTEHSRLARLMRDTSDWKLLQDSCCPVLLVKSYARRHIRKVLLAIRHRADEAIQEAANDRLLEVGRQISNNLGAELQVVTAYRDNDDYPDRQKFADRCGLPRNKVTAVLGEPGQAIITATREVGADLVVIARVARPGVKKRVGQTAEKLIDELYANILVLPMTGDE